MSVAAYENFFASLPAACACGIAGLPLACHPDWCAAKGQDAIDRGDAELIRRYLATTTARASVAYHRSRGASDPHRAAAADLRRLAAGVQDRDLAPIAGSPDPRVLLAAAESANTGWF